MCFGGMETTQQTNSTSNTASNQNTTGTSVARLPDWMKGAGEDHYKLARQILDTGYQGYAGPRVAGFSPNEQLATDLLRRNAGGNPYAGETEAIARMYGSAPGYQYGWSSVVDEGGPLGSIQGYMNPYLQAVLDPSLRAIMDQGAKTRQNIGKSAHMSGAFGDARHGVVESEQRASEAQLSSDVVNKGHYDAFAQALGLRSSDLARLFQTEQAQDNSDRARLDRLRTSGIDLTGLDKYNVSRDMGVSGGLATMGAKERGIEQAGLDKGFEEHLRATGWGNEQIKFLSAILGATPYDRQVETTGSQTGTSTTNKQQTTQQPDNSGWGILGSLAGALFAPFTGGLSLGGTLGGLSSMFGGGSSGLGGNPNQSMAGYDQGGNYYNFGSGGGNPLGAVLGWGAP